MGRHRYCGVPRHCCVDFADDYIVGTHERNDHMVDNIPILAFA